MNIGILATILMAMLHLSNATFYPFKQKKHKYGILKGYLADLSDVLDGFLRYAPEFYDRFLGGHDHHKKHHHKHEHYDDDHDYYHHHHPHKHHHRKHKGHHHGHGLYYGFPYYGGYGGYAGGYGGYHHGLVHDYNHLGYDGLGDLGHGLGYEHLLDYGSLGHSGYYGHYGQCGHDGHH